MMVKKLEENDLLKEIVYNNSKFLEIKLSEFVLSKMELSKFKFSCTLVKATN